MHHSRSVKAHFCPGSTPMRLAGRLPDRRVPVIMAPELTRRSAVSAVTVLAVLADRWGVCSDLAASTWPVSASTRTNPSAATSGAPPGMVGGGARVVVGAGGAGTVVVTAAADPAPNTPPLEATTSDAISVLRRRRI